MHAQIRPGSVDLMASLHGASNTVKGRNVHSWTARLAEYFSEHKAAAFLRVLVVAGMRTEHEVRTCVVGIPASSDPKLVLFIVCCIL